MSFSTISAPRFEDLERLSNRYGFDCSQEDLEGYRKIFLKKSLPAYRRLWELPDAIPLVKYSRTLGHRPDPGTNTHNAWYWRCSIKGAQGGKLSGYKVGIKDNVFVAGIPLMNGSRTIEGFVPEHDAAVVTRLLDAGAEIIGKTTCEDLCVSGASYHTAYGAVKNPWNMEYTSGGSSSGSAVAVATGDADLAIAGDQGGSVRMPSSCCGIVGLKPTYGLVPYTGAIPIESSIDHLGPMARNVEDCALMMEVIAGYDDAGDFRQPHTGIPSQKLNFTEKIKEPTDKIHVAVLREGFQNCHQDVLHVVGKAMSILKKSGKFAAIEEVSVPLHSEGGVLWYPVQEIGGVHQLLEGFGYGSGIYGAMSSRFSEKCFQGLKTNAHALAHTVKFLCLSGGYMKNKYGMSLYAKAQNISLELRRQYNKVLESYDVIVMPTLPETAWKIPEDDADMEEDTQLPVGFMIVGRHFDDGTVLQVGKVAEDLFKPLQTRKLG